MKFTILQQDFAPHLQAVARCCGVRSQLPVLANILLTVDQGKIKLSATNLEIGVVQEISAADLEEGEITVPSRTLVEMIANLPAEKLELSSDALNQLKITTNNFSSEINGISASEFPSIPLSSKDSINLDSKLLLKALPQISFAAAVDEGRPILTGILFEIKDQKLQLVATDGYRLAHKTLAVEEKKQFKALIPRRTLEEVARLLTEEEADNVEIASSEDQNQIIFTFGNIKLSSRLIEGNFPAWEKIIPSESKTRIICDRAELLKAVKLASVFTRNEANFVKMQNLSSKLVLTSEAKELGSQKKEVEVQSEGEEIQIAFNVRYLQEALMAFNSSQLIIELSGNLSAAVIKPMGEEGLEYIIMPVNLN